MKVTHSALLCLVLASLLRPSKGFQWRKCGEGSFAVQSVTLTPDRISPGVTAQFRIDTESGMWYAVLVVSFFHFVSWHPQIPC
jgi:hypothetical protein